MWNVDECGAGNVPQQYAVAGVTGEKAFQSQCGDKLENTTIVSYVSTYNSHNEAILYIERIGSKFLGTSKVNTTAISQQQTCTEMSYINKQMI